MNVMSLSKVRDSGVVQRISERPDVKNTHVKRRHIRSRTRIRLDISGKKN